MNFIYPSKAFRVTVFILFLLNTNNCYKSVAKEYRSSSSRNKVSKNTPQVIGWAYSVVHISFLAGLEHDIYQLVKNCTVKLESDQNSLHIIKNWIQGYENSTLKVTGHIQNMSGGHKMALLEKIVSGNPLLTYKMIWRYAYELGPVMNHVLKHTVPGAAIGNVAKYYLHYKMPTQADLEMVMDNLLRILDVYYLDPVSIIKGNFGSTNSNVTLTESEALHIGIFAHNAGKDDSALNWFYAVYKMNSREELTPMIVESIEALLIDKLGPNHPILWNHMLKLENQDFYVNRIYTSIRTKLHVAPQSVNTEESYRALCRTPQTQYQDPRLRCWYERGHHPYSQLCPHKVELLNEEIHLIRIYDLVDEKLITKMKQSAKEALLERQGPEASMTRKYFWKRTASDTVVAKHWAASVAILNEDQDILRLNLKFERVTGLVVDNSPLTGAYMASDKLHVNMYAAGGHHGLHMDEDAPDVDIYNGELMGTFLTYLNDVEEGGYTAFAHIGISVVPIKGSAIFSYNRKRNGELDPRTEHGGCPVVFGTKWSMTTWVRLYPNFQRRKCSLKPFD